MTPGKARGKKSKYGIRAPKAAKLVASAAADLPQRFLTVTPGYTGGHNGNDPAILRDRSLRI
jgi:hypothetical protein